MNGSSRARLEAPVGAAMSDILFHYYRVNPTTWFYLSSLLSIALFFKFNRLLSVRNVDLLGLVLPHQAMVDEDAGQVLPDGFEDEPSCHR